MRQKVYGRGTTKYLTVQSLSAYPRLGAALLLAGAIATPVFYFVAGSVPLTALALSSVLLGAIALMLARSLPAIPPRAAQLLLETGMENLAGLIEELGVEERAVYLPSALAGGKPRALIPLGAGPSGVEVTRPLAGRLIVQFGKDPEDVGLLVATPGAAVMSLLETPPGPSSSELEAALARVLVGSLDLATSVAVAQEPGSAIVSVSGLRLDRDDLWVYRLLGTPVASMAAAVVAEGLGRPVVVLSEERVAGMTVVRLGVGR